MKASFPIGSWRPDMPEFAYQHQRSMPVLQAENMHRSVGQWNPALIASEGEVAGQLNAAPVRSWQFRFSDGNRYTFVEATNGMVYRYTSGNAWSAVTTTSATERWSMVQFGDAIYAVTSNQSLLKWTTSSSAFAPVNNGPSGARIIAVVRNFLVVADLNVNGTRSRKTVRWSGLEAPDEWTAGTKFSDSQVIADLGDIHDIVSLEDAYVLCSRGVKRMVQIGGTYTFSFTTLGRAVGVNAQGLAVVVGESIYYASRTGFVMLDASGRVTQIGAGKVDREFLQRIDANKISSASTVYEQWRRLVRWTFSTGSAHPNASFVFSTETWTWGYRSGGFQVVIPQSSGSLTWADIEARFGGDFAVVSQAFTSFLDTRLQGGVDIPHAFTSSRRLNPASRIPASVMTTNLIRPVREGRVVITSIRPWTDGFPDVAIASAEEISPQIGLTDFQDCPWVREQGVARAFRSGRMFQFRFNFDTGDPWSFFTGFDIEWERDGML